MKTKLIKGHSNYTINEFGSIINLSGRKPGQPIKQTVHKSKGKQTGYLYVHLLTQDTDNGLNTSCYTCVAVHRLVCLMWNGAQPEDKPWVNHKDGNKLNNHYSNLEWSTISDNIKHAHNTGLRNVAKGVDNPLFGRKASLATKQLMSQAKQGERHPKFKGYYIANWAKFTSANAAGKHLNINPRVIYSRCHNPNFKLKGYYFLPIS